MTEEHEYDVVLDVLQKHYDVLKDINERNRILLGGGVMDQIRFDQMDEIKEAMRWWKERKGMLRNESKGIQSNCSVC